MNKKPAPPVELVHHDEKTGRYFRAQDVCAIAGCGKLGTHHLGVKLWAKSDTAKNRVAFLIETPLVLCADHTAQPVEEAPAFFLPESRARMSAAIVAMGREDVNYDAAEWDLQPIDTSTVAKQ